MTPKPDNIPLDHNYVELVKLRAKYAQLQGLASALLKAVEGSPVSRPFAVTWAARALAARPDLLTGAP